MCMRFKRSISFSLSNELISELENRRGLVKKSNFVEHYLRRALGLKNEETSVSKPIAKVR